MSISEVDNSEGTENSIMKHKSCFKNGVQISIEHFLSDHNADTINRKWMLISFAQTFLNRISLGVDKGTYFWVGPHIIIYFVFEAL